MKDLVKDLPMVLFLLGIGTGLFLFIKKVRKEDNDEDNDPWNHYYI